MRHFMSAAVGALGTILYAMVFAFVLLLIGFSSGNVLDLRIAAGQDDPIGLVAISLFCWAVLLILPVQLALAARRWQSQRRLNRRS